MNFTGRTAMITGAGSGLGALSGEKLAELGFSLDEAVLVEMR